MNPATQAPFILAIIFLGIIGIIRSITHYGLRRRMIDSGMVDEQSVRALYQQADNYQTALKWGLITLFAGIGLIIISIFNIDSDSALPYGIEAVCVSLGFLLYYRIVRAERKDAHKK